MRRLAGLSACREGGVWGKGGVAERADCRSTMARSRVEMAWNRAGSLSLRPLLVLEGAEGEGGTGVEDDKGPETDGLTEWLGELVRDLVETGRRVLWLLIKGEGVEGVEQW